MIAAGEKARGRRGFPVLVTLSVYLLRAARGEATGVPARLACAGLRVLSWLYLAAISLLALLHRLDPRGRAHAPCPVISVGNLSVGGTGKSTVAATFAGWLLDAGFHPAILSRGYGARRRRPVEVVSDGTRIRLGPGEGGDEPVMLARRLAGVPVLIGPRRPLSARAAGLELGADVCILDDGLQVRNLAKDLEVVLLESARPFDTGFVLPRGMLREPPAHLGRAHVVMLMEPQGVEAPALDALYRRVRSLAPGALVVEARRAPSRLWDLADGAEVSLASLRGAPVVALSGIGNPHGFERLLEETGVVVHPIRFADHHHYTEEDLGLVRQRARAVGAAAVITTDKDAVKLAALSQACEPAPVPVTSAGVPAARTLGHLLVPAWGAKGGCADGRLPAGSPAGRVAPAPGLARRLATPFYVLSIRLQFMAGEQALRERVFAAAREGGRA